MRKRRYKYAVGGLLGGGGGGEEDEKKKGASTVPTYSGPHYAAIDPSRPEEVNKRNTLINFYKALEFKRSLTGPYNNVIEAKTIQDNPVYSNWSIGSGSAGVGRYTVVDPAAITAADSVINTTRPILYPNIKRRFGGKFQLGGSYMPNEAEARNEQGVNTAVSAVGAINPIIGAGLKIGQAIGKASVDEDGLYKSKAGEFFTNSLDPTTGIQNLKDLSKDFTLSTVANQLSLGLFGESATQRRRQRELEARKTRERLQNSISMDQKIGAMDYDFSGSSDGSIYEMGGKLNMSPIKAPGGQLKPLNSDTVEVKGATHEQGGVQIPGAELENNETVANDFVFSDILGFADRHKPIAKQIGKIEKKPLNRERRVSLEILRKKEAALRQEQEALKENLGLQEERGFQLGGYVKVHDKGADPFYYNASAPFLDERTATNFMKGIALTEPEGMPTLSRRVSWRGADADSISEWNRNLLQRKEVRNIDKRLSEQKSRWAAKNPVAAYYSKFGL